MQSYSRRAGAHEVVIQCRPDLEAQAQFVLDSLSKPGVELREGAEVKVGWSILVLRKDAKVAGRLVVHEPDFDRNPLIHFRPDVTATLALHSTQLWLAKQARTRFTLSTYRQRLAIVPRGALREARVTLFRTADQRFENDSGWLVFPDALGAQAFDREDREIIHAHELMKRRPALVQALCLPPEYMVKFNGDVVDGIAGPR